jgi:hypothetical protein
MMWGPRVNVDVKEVVAKVLLRKVRSSGIQNQTVLHITQTVTGFEVLTAVVVKNSIFLDITLAR